MFQELNKTCAKQQSSHGRPISCQLNRLKEVRKKMNRLNCLETEMHRTNQGIKKMNRLKHETKQEHQIKSKKGTQDMFRNGNRHENGMRRWRRKKTYVVVVLG